MSDIFRDLGSIYTRRFGRTSFESSLNKHIAGGGVKRSGALLAFDRVASRKAITGSPIVGLQGIPFSNLPRKFYFLMHYCPKG